MGLWDSIKKLTKPYSDDELDNELDPSPARPSYSRQESGRSYTDYAEAPAVQENNVRHTFLNSVRASAPAAAPASAEKGSVRLGGSADQPMKLMVMKPERFEDASGIAESMRERNSIVLSLESISKEDARRLVDFISGAVYMQGGHIRRITSSTFVITPPNVDLSGDALSMLDSRLGGETFF